jgi:hypothetical protein
MDDHIESIPLTGRVQSTSRIWWILTIAILIFSFFAFVFAVASFANTKSLQYGVNNNFYNQQGGLIEETYAISAKSVAFDAGTVLSFCDSASSVCPGLGPRWNQTLYPPGSFSPAVVGDLVQISPDLAVYAWATAAAPNTLRVIAIRTSSDPPAFTSLNPTLLPLDGPVSWISLKAYSSSSFVVAYNSHNSSYLVGGSATPTTAVVLGISVNMFEIPYTADGFVVDVSVLKNSYILVTYGPNSVGASFLGYTLSGMYFSPINVAKTFGYGIQITNDVSTTYLGNASGVEYFLQATGDKAVLGSFSFASGVLALSLLRTLAYTNVFYDTVSASSLLNGYIAIAGVQTEQLDVALTISIVLQWSTQSPYLTSFTPSNLLETQEHQLVNNQLSSCYVPPTSNEPAGELFFSYVDSLSDRAKLIRAKIASTSNNDVQLLPSPPIDISTFTYTQFGTSIAPLVACPSSSGVLVAYQYLGTYFNTFVWEGGYRFAGIAEESYDPQSSKSSMLVLRQGISESHRELQAGFSYYLTNSGHLRPHTSIYELFSPTGFSARIGVAISNTHLLLEPYVFESITRGGP